jgi:hypothetical protein
MKEAAIVLLRGVGRPHGRPGRIGSRTGPGRNDMRNSVVYFVVLVGLLLGEGPCNAMDASYGAFQQVMVMPIGQQADKADAVLKAKYERPSRTEGSQEYMGYGELPLYAMTRWPTYVAYRIAAQKPELLAAYDYFGTCGDRKLRNLLECFLKNGEPGNYIDLAVSCPICYNEAISVFLWNEIDVPPDDIKAGLQLLYDWSSQ